MTICNVILWQMVFGVIVCQVVAYFIPDQNWSCEALSFSQLICMASDLMHRVMMVLLTYPVTVVLSTWIGEQSCGHPILFKEGRGGPFLGHT